MKTPKKYYSALLVIPATLLLSWNHFNYSKNELKGFLPSYSFSELTDDEVSALVNENGEQNVPDRKLVPAAEDVLVQKIPGDNNHLLLMAFYSKENFSEPVLSLMDGSGVVLRDDGEGFDKKAGDGLYTAKITTDVKEFRRQAMDMTEQMKKSNFKPVRYIHREMVYDPDASESFDTQKFDANEAVSISGLTDALSSDLSTTATTLTTGTTATTPTTAITATTVTAATASGGTTTDSIRRNSIIITNRSVVE